MNHENQLGRVEGTLHETVMRIDRLEKRYEEHDQAVLKILTEIRDRVSSGVWVSTLAGAFAGAVAGGITAIFCVQWLVALIKGASTVGAIVFQ